jgi:hypothetical protein
MCSSGLSYDLASSPPLNTKLKASPHLCIQPQLQQEVADHNSQQTHDVDEQLGAKSGFAVLPSAFASNGPFFLQF